MRFRFLWYKNATSNVTSNYVLGTLDSQLAAKWSESCGYIMLANIPHYETIH